jgi:predicted phage terminase large subunit-like protein
MHDQDFRQDALRAALRNELFYFICKTFTSIRQGEALKVNWHIEAIAWKLQQVAEGHVKRLIITVPPRSLKSVCASVALPAWFLGRDPSRQVACASYAEGLSVDLHNLCRKVIQEPWYARTFPALALNPRKNTDTEFKTSAGGGRFATSVDGVFTGRGADLIIIDDPIKPIDAMSEAALSRATKWFDQTVTTRLNDKETGAIVVVMQRLHPDDLVGHLLAREGWTHLNLPAVAEEDETIQIGPDIWHVRKVGDLLHAERDSSAVLAEMKLNLGSLQFDAQYQQRPVRVDGNMIKWKWFKRFAELPYENCDDQIVQSWDTASKSDQLNDFSVCTTWRIHNNAYYLLDVFRERLDFPELRKVVVELKRRFRATDVLIEDKGSGTSLIQELNARGDVYAIAIEPKGDKMVRAAAQSAQIEAGRVFIPQDASWLGDFQSEISAFPKSRYDDQVDSMSQFLIWAFQQEHYVPRIRQL